MGRVSNVRAVASGRCRWSLTAVLLVALLMLMAAGAAAAQPGGDASPATSQAAQPANGSPVQTEASPAPSYALTCAVAPSPAIYGSPVNVTGSVSPAEAGLRVTVALDGAPVATVATTEDGSYAASFTATGGGEVAARLDDGTTSEGRQLVVKPKVTLTTGMPIPFLPLKWVVRVAPATYAGDVTVSVFHHDVRVVKVTKRVRDGRVEFALPLRGIELFLVKTVVPASGDLATRSMQKGIRATTRKLSVGSSGPHVKGLLTALQRLKIRVPSVGSTLTRDHSDAVMGFQKAYRLPRTYQVDADDWRKLDTAKPVRPRYASPYDHLEVDKTRQILMMVRDGKLRALIAVSTGATGNTPEGSFRVQQKHPYTTSGYGGILYRTIGFHGNFAIHGYSPVPPYPASHGCVREPMWVADWIYDRTFVGERVYVFR